MAGDDDPSTSDAVVNLSLVLLRTFASLGLGYGSTRLGYVDKHRGELRALQFFVGKISLPMCCFKVVATSNLESLHWGVISACNLGKVTVFVLTFGLTYFAYKAGRLRGQRLMACCIFGLFVTASNDLAIGIPVIKALYGESMMPYIGANVFVFQVVLQPLIMLVFEVSRALTRAQENGEQVRCREVLLLSLRGVASNALILASAAGLLWQFLLHDTLTTQDGEVRLPSPLYDVVDAFTQPFLTLFLFINGAMLNSADLTFWSATLVLMKGIVCAYVSYALAQPLLSLSGKVRNAEQLSHFAFFYGSLPAGGAPLILATQADPALAPLIASACLFCLVVAGPVEILTTLYLLDNNDVQYDQVHRTEQQAAAASLVCGVVALGLVLCPRTAGTLPRRLAACYASAIIAYAGLTLAIPRLGRVGRVAYPLMYSFSLLQNTCDVIVILISYMLVAERPMRPRAQRLAAAVLTIVVLVGSLSTPLTSHELCSQQPASLTLLIAVVWKSALLLATLAPGVWHIRLRRHERSLPTTPATPGFALAAAARKQQCGLSVALVMLQVLRILMEVIDASLKVSKPASERTTFTPMLELADILEHGQGCILLLGIVVQEGARAFCTPVIAAIQGFGRQIRVPELEDWFFDPEESLETPGGHSRSISRPLNFEALDDVGDGLVLTSSPERAASSRRGAGSDSDFHRPT